LLLLQGYLKGGEEASVVTAPLQIRDVNEKYLTPGKLQNVETVQESLEAGTIAPLSP
jgi:hypothetical protein